MTELTRLVDAPGASSLPYVDPAFPDRPLVLHAARPRQYDAATPVLFAHHGVRRNGRDYRDYWLDLVDEARVLAIAIEFPEASFPEYLWYHFGNLHTKDGTPNPREAWTFGLGETDVDTEGLRALLAFPITAMAGTEDVLTTGRFFPKGPRSMRQGATRYERAQNYVQSGHAAAAALQTSCAWKVIDVPGVGHDGKRMSAAAAPVVAAALRDGS